jgi:hypothetical protein
MNLALKMFSKNWLAGFLERKFALHIDVFCADDVPPHVQQGCGVELGGIVAVGIILSGTHVGENDTEKRANLEDADWWTNGENESPQTHWVILPTRGSKAAGTPVEGEGFGLQSVERIGDDQEINFEALGITDNRDFWAGVNKRQSWGFVSISKGISNTRIGRYYEDTSIYSDELIEQSIKSRLRWAVNVKLSTDLTPALPFTAPSSVFTP